MNVQGIRMTRMPVLQTLVVIATAFTSVLASCDVAPSRRATATDDRMAGKAVADPKTFTCTVASITDGDTFRCFELERDGKQIRVRLSGVAAREKSGGCTEGHPCPEAPAEAATAAIEALALGRSLQWPAG